MNKESMKREKMHIKGDSLSEDITENLIYVDLEDLAYEIGAENNMKITVHLKSAKTVEGIVYGTGFYDKNYVLLDNDDGYCFVNRDAIEMVFLKKEEDYK